MTLRKIFAAFLSAAVVATSAAIPVLADEVEPIEVTSDQSITITNYEITGTDGPAISVTNDATLELTVTGDNVVTGAPGYAGIYVAPGASLIISGEGTLTANGGDGGETGEYGIIGGGAGIGGNGGAAGAQDLSSAEFGTITIEGATVNATGGHAGNNNVGAGAGIGSGGLNGSGAVEGIAGDIEIYDGTVTAVGGKAYNSAESLGGAGIGSGGMGNYWEPYSIETTITINGGDEGDDSNWGGAGIGGGDNGYGDKITIDGEANVTATGGGAAAGIGGGHGDGTDRGSGTIVSLSIDGDATVVAKGGSASAESVGGAGIGTGMNCASDFGNITILKRANVTAAAGANAMPIGYGSNSVIDPSYKDRITIADTATVDEIPFVSGTDSTNSAVDEPEFTKREVNDVALTAIVDEDGNPPDLDDIWGVQVKELQSAPDGYTEDDDGNVTISTPRGFTWFAVQISNGNTYENKTITLQTNIDLTDHLWRPAGLVEISNTGKDITNKGTLNEFKGTFNGNDKTITFYGHNRYHEGYDRLPSGLFAKNAGTIKNLNVAGEIETWTGDIGCIALENSGVIENCKSSVTISYNRNESYSGECGGIAGTNNGIIRQCENSGSITVADYWRIGGIVGYNAGEITQCVNKGEIRKEKSGSGYCGGIVGTGTPGKNNVSDCTNEADITAKSCTFAGGIAGSCTNVENCTNTGTLDIASTNLGGIAGECETVRNCTNNGALTNSGSGQKCGGIAGDCTTAENCTNNGKVESGAAAVGGVAGEGNIITGCTNTGNVSSKPSLTGYVGGIVGKQDYFDDENNIDVLSGNTNNGSVSGTGRKVSVGCLAGTTDVNPDKFSDNTYIGGEDESAIGSYTGTLSGEQTKEDFESEGSTKVIADLKDTAGNLTVEIDKSTMSGFFSEDMAEHSDASSYSVTVDPIAAPEDELERDSQDNNSKLEYVDINICRDGKPINFETEDEITVTFTIGEPIQEDSTVYVYHYTDSWEKITPQSTTDGAVTFTTNSLSPFAYTYTPSQTAPENTAAQITVSLEKVTGVQNVYDIVLKADSGNLIYGFMSAEFEFGLSGTDGIGYDIVGGAHMNVIQKSDKPNHYEINMDGVNDHSNTTSSEIPIGQVVFSGYGKGMFEITSGVVHTEKTADNIVDTFEYNDGTGNLEIAEGLTDPGQEINIPVETVPVQINVMFPNEVKTDNSTDYTDMTVIVKGGAETEQEPFEREIKLGSPTEDLPEVTVAPTKFNYTADSVTSDSEGDSNANGYKINLNVPVPEGVGNRYTFTFKGAGYRTYSVDAVVKKNGDDPFTVTVWNNVMDDKHNVLISDGSNPTVEAVTFLAGDIIEDNTINLYDLSAAVAYFGKTGMTSNAEANKDYIKYDLNRDGAIDSKDIAMVLVSWGN